MQDLLGQFLAANFLHGLPNRRHDQLLVAGKQERQRGRRGRVAMPLAARWPGRCSSVRSTKPAATISLSCSVIAVRVTRVSRINSPTDRGGLPTSSFITRIPAAVIVAPDMSRTSRLH